MAYVYCITPLLLGEVNLFNYFCHLPPFINLADIDFICQKTKFHSLHSLYYIRRMFFMFQPAHCRMRMESRGSSIFPDLFHLLWFPFPEERRHRSGFVWIYFLENFFP